GWEDFGIAPVEAQAAGRPVVAYGRGGALETVADGVTGVFFEEQTVEGVVEGMRRLEGMRIDPAACRRNAERFRPAQFRSQLLKSVQAHLDGARGAGDTRVQLLPRLETA